MSVGFQQWRCGIIHPRPRCSISLQCSAIFHLPATALTTPDTQFRLCCISSKFTLPALISVQKRVQNRMAGCSGTTDPGSGWSGPQCCSVPPSVGAWVSPNLVSRPTIPVAGRALFWRDLQSLSPKDQPPVTPSEKQIASKKTNNKKRRNKKMAKLFQETAAERFSSNFSNSFN